ncbi:MAG: peptide deformylase [Candidatus Melainabacteria bacterium]|nr:peptide deformylase [Candidatus Melainabacteria bacterium]
MSIRPIVIYGDPVFRRPSEPVHKRSAKIQALIQDMWDTLSSTTDMVGMAAPQIGVQRCVAIALGAEDGSIPALTMINPKLVQCRGAIHSEESSPSFPGVRLAVWRYQRVVLRFQDLQGRPCQLALDAEDPAQNLLCRVVQHEVDHLNGVVFVDRAVNPEEARMALSQNQLPTVEDRYWQSPPAEARTDSEAVTSSVTSSGIDL